ncbi:hypothetical protein MMC17_001485 [Xylographa soralifera]|nr:hypothetical protein [Xylographa soralifera]
MRPFSRAHPLALLLLSPLYAAQATTTTSTSTSTSALPLPPPTASANTSYPTASGPYGNLTASAPVLLVSNTTTTSSSSTTAPSPTAAAPVSVVFSTEMATAAAAPSTVTSIVVATGMQTFVTLPGATSTGPVGGVQTAGVGRMRVGGWRVGVGVGAGLWMLEWG